MISKVVIGRCRCDKNVDEVCEYHSGDVLLQCSQDPEAYPRDSSTV